MTAEAAGVQTAMLERLEDASARLAELVAEVDRVTAQRNDLVRRLLDHGVSVRRVAYVSGMSTQRVYQLRNRGKGLTGEGEQREAD